ncbi:hypothetical protein [Granulicella mallensis]|nr:hypothetical protein [Granulicella mallensis]
MNLAMNSTQAAHSDDLDIALGTALRDIVLRPRTTLFATWSWKAAAISAVIRASTFFASNLKSGHHKALRAMLVEAVFAIFAAGLLGAVSQRLRSAQPVWATALVVWLGMPSLMLLAQLGIHRAAGTPHLGTGLIVSFCFASISSCFSWYAMRRGVMLGGVHGTSLAHDLRTMPRVVLDFVLVGPRALLRVLTRS